MRRGSALSPSKLKLSHRFSHCERMSMSKDGFAHEQLHIMQFFCISPGAAMPPKTDSTSGDKLHSYCHSWWRGSVVSATALAEFQGLFWVSHNVSIDIFERVDE